jgi:poly-gamma-glutamate capsule biosynthesis protein CapA/YwtB (metallophosphatase superfamily)
MIPADILLYGVGDLCPNRDNPESILELAAPTLKQADILFGQLETNFSERGTPVRDMWPGMRAHPRNVRALTYGGFSVVSFASHHALDMGEDALFDTIDVVRQNGIAIIGAGRNIDEARKPAIIERKGTKVAFLAYCSILPRGFDARPNRSGIAPMKVSTSYEQFDWQPGTPPRILTFANKEHLKAMVEDVKKAKAMADVVVVSLKGGVHHWEGIVALYQKEVSYAAIDAGADLVLGHHARILKGIEVYKGKAVFHGLCNFAFDIPIEKMLGNAAAERDGGWEIDPEYPTYPFRPEARKTIIAKCIISDKKIAKVSFLPAMINRKSQPEILPSSDPRSTDVLKYVEWCCKYEKLNARLSRKGDEIEVNA